MCHLPAGTLHWARALVVSATLLLACQPAAAPTPATTSGGPPAAATAPAQAAAKPAQLSGSGAPAVPAPSLDWDRVLAATKSEGRVAVAGPPFPGLTSGMTREFERAHGIAVDYVGAAAV